MGASAGRKLTTFEVDAIRPAEKRIEVSDAGGSLRLVVQPSGARSWAVRYRFKGQPRKYTLGRYPGVTLAEARGLTIVALADVQRGVDPAAVKREERQRERDTIKGLVADYIAKWQKPRNRTWAETQRSLERVLVTRLGARDVREVTRRDLIRTLEGRNRRTLANVKRFFAWCVEQDLISASPAAGIRAPDPIASRDRVLSDDELRAFLRSLPELGDPWARLLELLALSIQRRSEVAEAAWPEIDMTKRLLTIDRGRSKNGVAHAVPLAPRALDIIDALPSKDDGGLLFPAERDGLGAVSGFSRAKRRLDGLMLAELRKIAEKRGDDPARVTLAPWRLHDLRRTGATRMAALGHPIHVVERVLNHVSGATTGGLIAVYQRHDFIAERRTALEDWARHLQGLRL